MVGPPELGSNFPIGTDANSIRANNLASLEFRIAKTFFLHMRQSIRKIEVNLIKFSKGLLLADVKHTFGSEKRIIEIW